MCKSTDCSSRGTGFESQYPQSSSKLPVTPVPGDPSFLASKVTLNTWCMDIHGHRMPINERMNKFLQKERREN